MLQGGSSSQSANILPLWCGMPQWVNTGRFESSAVLKYTRNRGGWDDPGSFLHSNNVSLRATKEAFCSNGSTRTWLKRWCKIMSELEDVRPVNWREKRRKVRRDVRSAESWMGQPGVWNRRTGLCPPPSEHVKIFRNCGLSALHPDFKYKFMLPGAQTWHRLSVSGLSPGTCLENLSLSKISFPSPVNYQNYLSDSWN